MKPRRLWLALALALLLSGYLLAGPARVGVIRVEKGSVTLNGKAISAPQLLEQGQTLVVAAGAAARLQLLGGAGELVIAGPKTVKVDGPALAKQAKAVKRGAVASVPDIGNTTRGATATVRRVASKRQPFRLSAPPQESETSWRFLAKEGDLFANEDALEMVEWSIYALSIDSSPDQNDRAFRREEVARGEYRPGEAKVEVARPLLAPGTRYLLCVTVSDRAQWVEIDYYEHPFRLLTPQEKVDLGEFEQQLRAQSRAQNSAVPLLELASLLLDWDQLQEAQAALQEARRHPNWSKLGAEVQEKADRFDRQLEKIWGQP